MGKMHVRPAKPKGKLGKLHKYLIRKIKFLQGQPAVDPRLCLTPQFIKKLCDKFQITPGNLRRDLRKFRHRELFTLGKSTEGYTVIVETH